MSERASIYEVVQIGVEAVPNTAVAAEKLLTSLSVEPAIKVETQKFRPMGRKFPSLVIPGKEWTQANLSGVATYTELIYPLASVLGYAAPEQQGATAAYKWTHFPNTSSPDTVKTFTVEQGSKVRASRFAGGLVRALTLDFSRDGIEVSGEMIGQALQDNVRLSTNARYTLTANATPPSAGTFSLIYAGQTASGIAYNATAAAVQSALEALSTIAPGEVMVTATVATGAGTLAVADNVYTIEFIGDLGQAPRTLTGTFTSLTASGSIALASAVTGVTPSEIDLVPVLPTEVSIYQAAAHADLDAASALERVLRYSWAITDRFGPIYPINASNGTSYAATVETEPGLEVKIRMEADAAGMSPLTTLREGDTTFFRVEAIGDEIEDPYFYMLQVDTALKVSDVSEFSDEDGVFAIEWTLTGVHDATWGKATQVVVINELTTL